MATNNEVRRQFTQQIVDAIEKGKTLPWRQPWRRSANAGRAANVISRRAYSGVNPLLCQVHAEACRLYSRWWGTYRQWSSLGCQVKRRPSHVPKGEWGSKIVFYKPITKRTTDEAGQETEAPSSIAHIIGQRSVVEQVKVGLDAAQIDGQKFPAPTDWTFYSPDASH